MRYTLPNGDWVDLVDRLNYAQGRRMKPTMDTPDAAGTLVASMVTSWALRDVDDQPIDFPGAGAEGIPLDALSRIPLDMFELIVVKAMEILPRQPDPKGSAGTSPGSPQAGSTRSRRNSPRSTSSPTTPAGPGATYNGHPRT